MDEKIKEVAFSEWFFCFNLSLALPFIITSSLKVLDLYFIFIVFLSALLIRSMEGLFTRTLVHKISFSTLSVGSPIYFNLISNKPSTFVIGATALLLLLTQSLFSPKFYRVALGISFISAFLRAWLRTFFYNAPFFIDEAFFYIKPRLAFLDDHEGFLRSLQKALSPYFDVEIFTNPLTFHQEISKRHLGNILSTLYESGDDQELEHPSISMALPTLPHHLKTFYEEIKPFTHIFVDHAMPQKTGIETLKDLKSCVFHKTLLTGFLNEEQAIDAFHREEINGYIRKDSLNFTQTLKETIERNSHSFYEKSEKVFFQSFPFLRVFNAFMIYVKNGLTPKKREVFYRVFMIKLVLV